MAQIEKGNVVRYTGKERRGELGGGRLWRVNRVTDGGKVRIQSMDGKPVQTLWVDGEELEYVQASSSLGAEPGTPDDQPDAEPATQADGQAKEQEGRQPDAPALRPAHTEPTAHRREAAEIGPHGFAVVAFTECAATVEGVYADPWAAESAAAPVRCVLRGLGVCGTAASMPARLVGDGPWSS